MGYVCFASNAYNGVLSDLEAIRRRLDPFVAQDCSAIFWRLKEDVILQSMRE